MLITYAKDSSLCEDDAQTKVFGEKSFVEDDNLN